LRALRTSRRAAIFVASLVLAAVGIFCGVTSLVGHDHDARTASRIQLTSTALDASHRKVPARDAFSGRISTATGLFRNDHGRATADLRVPRSGAVTRRLTLTIHGRLCNKSKHCVRLTGQLKGTLTAVPHTLADTGARFTIRARGTITHLGHVRMRGSVNGTGFVYRGRESLHLTVITGTGRLALDAHSHLVRGFTSP
jgi:hypothetical protein